MKTTNILNLWRLRLLFALLCSWCLPQFAGAAPLALPPTSPTSGYIAPGQSSPTPDYYTTANWANSPPMAKFVDTLPLLTPAGINNLGQYLPVADPDTTTFPGSDYYIIKLVEYYEQMHSDLQPTKLRGYVQLNANGAQIGQPHYLGPVIVATKDRPVRLKFINGLPTGEGGYLFIPVDESVMGAGEGPIPGEKYTQNRANIHLHGGRTPWISDGTPHQWIVPAGEDTPYLQGVSMQNVPDMCFDQTTYNAIPRGDDPDCLTGSSNPGPGASTYYFTNQQSTRLMFYHDHAWGITRLNVYAGEAAGYVITDAHEQDLVDRGIIPGTKSVAAGGGVSYGGMIPLIIQDKTFVNADVTVHPKSGGKVLTVRETDPLWNWGSKPKVNGVVPPTTGDLWMPHVYMPAQLPEGSATGGVNPYGRWMYGPWFYPATAVTHGPVDNPYYDPNCSSTNPFILAQCETPGQPTKIPGTPNVSMGMEAFQDSVVVNGTAFPTITVDPKPYRFRILNAASDRFWNLSFYVADSDPANVSIDPRLNPGASYIPGRSNQTEVKMAPASPAVAAANNWPADWPVDGREELVPDPGLCQTGGVNCPNLGPDFIQIGTEGGFLPFPAVRKPQPVTYITDPTAFWVGVVDKTGLALGPAERADAIVDFSAYAGKTLILYNDAPAAWPARVPGYDYFTGAPDMRDSGGYGAGGVLDPATGAWVADPNNPADVPHGILPGFAPNSRTVLQVIVNGGTGTSFNTTALENEFTSAAPATDLNPDRKTLFERTQEPIIVGQAAYSSAYPDSYFPPNFPWEGVNQINDEFLQFVTLAGEQVKIPTEPKGIHDEMGASFDPEYGRMSGNLAMQLQNASTLNALLVLYGFSDIPTETVINSPTVDIQVLPGVNGQPGTIADGTQIWKISHNGVDTHPIHFHIFDVQLINRVGWDGQIAMPEPNELGWKDTVKISPLMDTIVAVRPRAPALPFGIPNSLRPLNPGIPIDSVMDFTAPTPGSDWFLGNSFLAPYTGKYGFSSIDWVTGEMYGGDNVPVPYDFYKGVVTNVMYDFGWEYVWHCHILSHEEMDMMRPIVLKVGTALPPAFSAAKVIGVGKVDVTWNDPTPVDYVTVPLTYGDPANEVGFNVYRSTDGTTFTKLNTAILPANTTSFSDTSPVNGGVYKVEAFNASGSTWSPVTSSMVVTVTASTAPFTAPATVNLEAAVSAPLGVTVTSVDFYNGADLLGTVTTPPYTYVWSNVMGGDYTITAKATDSTGAVSNGTVAVSVGSALVANFTIDPPANITFCNTITLTSTSTGNDSQSWSLGGATTPTLVIPPSAIGTYPVTLTISDSNTGATASVTKNVVVTNTAPTAVANGPYTVLPGESLTLSAAGSNDNLDACSTAPLSYAWNVDNKGGYDYFTANPTITYDLLKTVLGYGEHIMTLRVTDANGGVGTATTTLTLPSTTAVMTAPLNGALIASNGQSFTWNDSGANSYALFAGSSPGSNELGIYTTAAGVTTTSVSGLPKGAIVYVRLWSEIGGNWTYNDYTYSTAAATAVMTAPLNGANIVANGQTFTWNNSGANSYALFFGASPGSNELGIYTTAAGVTTTVVAGLPSGTVYVRLWSENGANWTYNDYTYTVAAPTAVMTTPLNGATIASSGQVFTWNNTGANSYALFVGSSQSANNLGIYTTAAGVTTTTVSGLPGGTVYVRLWSENSGNWTYNDYTYTVASATAALSSPANGATLTGTSQTFSWNNTGANSYAIFVGTAPATNNLGIYTTAAGVTSTLVNLPANSSTIYVRLWSENGTNWTFNDYSYTSNP